MSELPKLIGSDGLDMLDWPETRAFLKLFGLKDYTVSKPPWVVAGTLSDIYFILDEGEQARLYVRWHPAPGCPVEQVYILPRTGYEVFRMSEFLAFAQRCGVPLDRAIQQVKFEFGDNRQPVYSTKVIVGEVQSAADILSQFQLPEPFSAEDARVWQQEQEVLQKVMMERVICPIVERIVEKFTRRLESEDLVGPEEPTVPTWRDKEPLL